MKRTLSWSLLIATITLLGFCNEVRAASLYGKVVDVNDGDSITVFNLNRPVKVRLLGIDAPEPGQPFAEIAKQHLKDLTMDKFVTVEYSSLGTNSSVVGRVILDGVDVCAQMIRDGAAWFDVNNNSRLSETERQIYLQSEAAARNEKRGIWQNGDAVAPWQYLKSQALKPTPSLKNGTEVPPKRNVQTASQLSPEAILGSDYVKAGDRSSESWLSAMAPIAREWRIFEPPGQNFSVIVPEGGRKSLEVTIFQEKPINTYAYLVRERTTMYGVIWLAGPSGGELDEVAIPVMMASVLKNFTNSYENLGEKLRCDAKAPKKVAVTGYTAMEFDLVGCHKPGAIRIYTRVVNGERVFILGLTFFDQPDPNVKRFFNSFKLKAE
ncbi:MAG TPA: thermonuclease family protein [Pyrinomonadaceae bacterium]|nr:thermonuclease family protein [Pyrinomonadaceae bacterium]